MRGLLVFTIVSALVNGALFFDVERKAQSYRPLTPNSHVSRSMAASTNNANRGILTEVLPTIAVESCLAAALALWSVRRLRLQSGLNSSLEPKPSMVCTWGWTQWTATLCFVFNGVVLCWIIANYISYAHLVKEVTPQKVSTIYNLFDLLVLRVVPLVTGVNFALATMMAACAWRRRPLTGCDIKIETRQDAHSKEVTISIPPKD